MSAYRTLTDLLTLVEDALQTGERYWRRHLRTPQHVIDEAVQLMYDQGRIQREVYDVLGPYQPAADEATTLRWVQALADRCDLMAWHRHRIAIAVDADLWTDLGGVADDDMISADVFGFLPYVNPFVHFPQPIVMPTGEEGIFLRVMGAFVFGMRHEPSPVGKVTAFCSTDDPRATSIAFKTAGLLTDADGNVRGERAQWDPSLYVPDLVWTTVLLSFDKPVMTFGELAEQVQAQFSDGETGVAFTVMRDVTESAQAAIEVVRRVLAFTLYLCCSNADLEVRAPVRRKVGKGRRDSARPRPPVLVQAGFRIGAAIRAYRVQRAAGPAAEPTGRTVKPHPRRAHFQRFRHGPGRALLSQPRYMPMTWVNGVDAITTIKPARR